MAVCNLFNQLSSASGNFMLFSQYVEDITHNYAEGDNWKVVPTGFVALNVDYSNIDKSLVLNGFKDDMNAGIPKYFQNCFENACAYGRAHYSEWTQANVGIVKQWTPEISRNLFWNCMHDGGFITTKQYGSETSTVKYIPEVVYYGDISMHSYNEHKGMGYNEIYCYIPTDAPKMNCQVVCITDSDINGRLCDVSNNSIFLEGHKDRLIEDYPQTYFYNRDFSMAFDDSAIGKLNSSSDSQYGINTIVLQYSVFKKLNGNWELIYNNIPMGMYIAGYFNGDALTNPITKYVTTSYGSGTSYGLRVCTRFSSNPSGVIMTNSDMVVDDSGYTNMCQLMTAMNENLSRMLDISKSAIGTTQSYKDLLSIFKNNRTNVPYIKDVNGVDCWFVNGRYIGSVVGSNDGCCNYLAKETVQKRLDNLMDDDDTNDWTYIEDPNGVDCLVISNTELAEELGLNPEDYHPEYGEGSTGGDGGASSGDPSDYIIADAEDVISKLNN